MIPTIRVDVTLVLGLNRWMTYMFAGLFAQLDLESTALKG